MAQISVIVAVYKMPEYLPRCIEGILSQTFRDLELILVDDGSPDNCGEICDSYAAKDSRVHVIHKRNAGVCAARNTGLDWVYDHSDSQWIFFHDNDDWIHPETLERMLSAAQAMQTDLCVCGYQETSGANPEIKAEDLHPVSWTPKAFFM
ncbi:MAG TPA: glycosyl transferase family 2, partial [Clostridiales bacterium]|nr:glycosyl transferase family 2 [Clostridiales bacterium]